MKEEERFEIIDMRQKPVELEMSDVLIAHGIYTVEQVKDLVEPNFFAIIPLEVLERIDLSANAKLLYAEISALARKSGRCFATNKYIAERLGLSSESIRSLLQELKDKGLVNVSINRTNAGTYRNINVIFSVSEGARRITRGGRVKQRGGGASDSAPKRDIEKRDIEKESLNHATQSVADDSIHKFISLFKAVNPSYGRLFGNKTQRAAAERLLNQHPYDWWARLMAPYSVKMRTDQFCPKAITPHEMESKLGKVIAYAVMGRTQEIKSENKKKVNI